jgi:hypothetical protein
MSEYVHVIESAAHRWWAWEGPTLRTAIRVAAAESADRTAGERHRSGTRAGLG